MNLKIKKFNIFWKEAIMFLLTQILGLFIALRLPKILEQMQGVRVEAEPIQILDFLIYFAIITAVILLFSKISKKGSGIFFQVIFVLAVFSGLDILFGVIIGEPGAALIAIGLIILRFIKPSILIHNLIIIGGLAGVGAMLGISLIPRDAIILLVVLAIYDVIAVYKTKHMVKMAKAMIKRNVILGIVIPDKISGLTSLMSDVKKEKTPGEKIIKPRKAKFMILGGGDLALPLLLITSVANENFWRSIIILIFSLAGLLVMHILFDKFKSRPMPALPPLAIFSILGYLFTLLVF